ncbi:hypothetical protein SAY87_023488 [Trapa incisa]|uniref:EamA domain-containing protein n=1 Tax=Trapa incisa TaxID=236973 RepID=A0AAN7KXV1_9MYRT|nr:hypothetical protein SAY87_023488 [Trapa incisa]
MRSKSWRWILGLIYIFSVATIWIAASFVVQSVVDAGVSPFLITYICNSLFIVYIPIVEIGRLIEDRYGSLMFWRASKSRCASQEVRESEKSVLLEENPLGLKSSSPRLSSGLEEVETSYSVKASGLDSELGEAPPDPLVVNEPAGNQVDKKGRWTRIRVAQVSLFICPFWFFAQLSFNLSLKYTTVTSNTILSSSSSLFTFLVSLVFLGERFSCVKLISVLLCMGGTIIVSLGDSSGSSGSSSSAATDNPLVGDFLSLFSAGMYAIYITLIRKKLPDDDEKSGHVSMAQFLGFLGLFNLFIFLPIALVLNFTKLEPFYNLTWKQFGLIVGKGLLDNVLSDYLWAKAVLLTTTTVATAGLTIQVPLAAIVDTVIGNPPNSLHYLGAIAVMIGFAGINIPADAFSKLKDASIELENEHMSLTDSELVASNSQSVDAVS